MSNSRASSPLELTGARAFEVLQRVLRGEHVERVMFPEPAYERLYSALTNKKE